MSSRRNVVLSSVAALALAVVILTAGSLAGILPTSQNVQVTNNMSNQGGNQGATTTTTAGGSPGGESPQPAQTGTLSILATDPPQVPSGVTSVYMTFDQVLLHPSGSSSQNGWIALNASATVDAISLIGVGQTIISARVPVGSYDGVELHLNSAMVTYNGSTFSVAPASNNYEATLAGVVQVSGSQGSAVMLDIQPLVLNVASTGGPAFVFNAALSAISLNASDVTPGMNSTGFRFDLSNLTWWGHFSSTVTSNITITGEQLTNSSFSVTVKNTGDTSQVLRMAILSIPSGPIANPPRSMPFYQLPTLSSSFSFAVQPDGTLQLLPSAEVSLNVTRFINPIFAQGGYTLAPGASVTLKYSGSINLLSISSSGLGYEITVVSDTTQTVAISGTMP
ncbi:MAG TPA: DUF4382 domain-containing protein [Conexivisphaerales archaeon]|nr:DUF4382 domain-containing protein [Conexivisphaerales archaeon]